MKSAAVDSFANSPPPAPAPVVLFVGYGNLLRSDDGVGPAIVSRLAGIFAGNPLCACLTAHQLTPEIAEQVAGADRVVFIDASVEQGAGVVRIRRLAPEHVATSPLGHAASPEAILALAKALYHRAPRAWSIAVGAANLAVGDRLSPPVARAANRLCRRLSFRIRRWCRFSDKPLVIE
jgi:hydrogenase maturation protease